VVPPSCSSGAIAKDTYYEVVSVVDVVGPRRVARQQKRFGLLLAFVGLISLIGGLYIRGSELTGRDSLNQPSSVYAAMWAPVGPNFVLDAPLSETPSSHGVASGFESWGAPGGFTLVPLAQSGARSAVRPALGQRISLPQGQSGGIWTKIPAVDGDQTYVASISLEISSLYKGANVVLDTEWYGPGTHYDGYSQLLETHPAARFVKVTVSATSPPTATSAHFIVKCYGGGSFVVADPVFRMTRAS
jgi:hypothetical protein